VLDETVFLRNGLFIVVITLSEQIKSELQMTKQGARCLLVVVCRIIIYMGHRDSVVDPCNVYTRQEVKYHRSR
jgi:hypothetical protein